MTYVWATWLADALRAEGCTVREESGWSTRGRPASSGPFDPFGILWHHTGTHASMDNPHPTLSMCINGRPDLSGPLCHVLIGYDGMCHVIAAGRANHAGRNDGSGPIPAGDGNAQMIGFEIDYDGTQPMAVDQYRAAVLAASAVLRHMGRGSDYARQHKETSAEGKWDPGGYDPGPMRADTAAALAGDFGAPTGPTTLEVEDMVLIYGKSPYLLSGRVLVPITTGDKDRALAAGVPCWGVDAATWPNLVEAFGEPVGVVLEE